MMASSIHVPPWSSERYTRSELLGPSTCDCAVRWTRNVEPPKIVRSVFSSCGQGPVRQSSLVSWTPSTITCESTSHASWSAHAAHASKIGHALTTRRYHALGSTYNERFRPQSGHAK